MISFAFASFPMISKLSYEPLCFSTVSNASNIFLWCRMVSHNFYDFVCFSVGFWLSFSLLWLSMLVESFQPWFHLPWAMINMNSSQRAQSFRSCRMLSHDFLCFSSISDDFDDFLCFSVTAMLSYDVLWFLMVFDDFFCFSMLLYVFPTFE